MLVYDASSEQDYNPCAARMTTSVSNGLAVQIHGDSVAFYTTPGMDFTLEKWAELDNCIYEELISVFEEGRIPNETELAELVLNFHAGKYRYAEGEGEEDEDANKDDGGKELGESFAPAGVTEGWPHRHGREHQLADMQSAVPAMSVPAGCSCPPCTSRTHWGPVDSLWHGAQRHEERQD